jgi:chaperonin GroES
MTDHRQYAPATARNRDFILDVLRDVLPATGTILEVASGPGEHITHFARNLPSLVFQPSDPEPDALLSVAAWVKAANVANARAPIVLDASQSFWPIANARCISPEAGIAGQPGAKPMKFRPLHDRVVIRRIEGEDKTKGGIIIPDTVKEKPQEGEVIAAGPGARDESGKLVPLDLKAGDRVLFGKWSGTEVKIDGEDLLIMKESDVMGVIEGASATKKKAA